ncbi:hypothetical protein GCM10022215_38240 [Nocardioides fonticola]|uniref:Uncharacterized protein n=1 Tax=Nocardioides fonticola TaxID=450363 RepID=A0ABP7XXN8_9ACTN
MAAIGGVVHRDLPGQVRVPVPGRQFVQTHHIGSSNTEPPGSDAGSLTNPKVHEVLGLWWCSRSLDSRVS